jgi:hypothetical protein
MGGRSSRWRAFSIENQRGNLAGAGGTYGRRSFGVLLALKRLWEIFWSPYGKFKGSGAMETEYAFG